MPEGEEIPVSLDKAGGDPPPRLSDSPVSSPLPRTPVDAPGPSARGSVPVRSQGLLVLAISPLTPPLMRMCIVSAVVRTTAG